MKPTRTSQHWLLAFNLSLIGFAVLMDLRGSRVPAVSLLAVAVGSLLWQGGLYVRDLRCGDQFDVVPSIKKPHYYQIAFQGSVFLYWSLYWDPVTAWAPLILAQIAFAYVFEALLSWSRHKTWRLGFGPWPIVGSINLFFWFKEDFFYLQLLLIAGTQLTKELVTWKRDGRTTHIFNPSGIVVAIAGLSIMLTGRIDMAVGLDLIHSFSFAPNFFEVLLLVGLAVQFCFSTTLITLGAALSLSLIYFSLKPLGLAPFAPFDTSVLIGLTLLATDPQTSSSNRVGKFLFGLSYGLAIFMVYAWLRSLQQPAFFDKIFAVVVVNLLVKHFDVAGNWISDRVSSMRRTTRMFGNRFLHIGAYAVLFVAILPTLKARNDGFVDPFPPHLLSPSRSNWDLYAKSLDIGNRYPDVRKPFGFWAEYIHFDEHAALRRDDAQVHVRLARVLHSIGAYELAIERLERAAKKDPKYAPLLAEAKADANR